MTNEQRDARLLQGMTGASYTTCLLWIRELRGAGELPRWEGVEHRRQQLRAAVSDRWPNVKWLEG